MENMKRALSAFLALVLVLGMVPGVPVFASAEEMESLPETLALETTEATTEATTEPETEPVTGPVTEPVTEPVEQETTAPVQTEATVPEETEAQQTLPAETVPEETAPQETLQEETVPQETMDELTASQDAMDAQIDEPDVTGIVVTADKTYTYVGDRVTLKAEIQPKDAWDQDVKFRVLNADGNSYNEELLQAGKLEVYEAGTYEIVADSVNDSYTYESNPDIEPCVVEFVDYTMKINTKAVPKENWFDVNENGIYGDEDDELKVMIHGALTLDAHYRIPAAEGSDKEYEVITPISNPNIEWYLEDGDYEYATVIPDGKEVTIRAREVSETKTITLYAKDNDLFNGDGQTGIDQVKIRVYPQPYKIAVEKDGVEIPNGEEIIVDLNNIDNEGEFDLEVKVWPAEATEPLNWKTSDKKVIVEHDILSEKPLVEDTSVGHVKVHPYAGSTTITISSVNYPDISTKVIIKRIDLVPEIEWAKKSLQVKDLVSGQSATLYALDPRDDEIMESDVVKWELSDEDQEYATITKNGKLTAKSGLHIGKTVTVKCSVIDNEEATLEHPVNIHPKADRVEIWGSIPGPEETAYTGESGNITGQTLAVRTNDNQCKPFKLEAKLYPQDDAEAGEIGAMQDVTWSSSNTSIAKIDSDTNEIRWQGKNGLVTITATAKDGSRKSASVKLQFGVIVEAGKMAINVPEEFFLRSGKSWTFSVTFDQTPQPTNKKVVWSLVNPEDAQYVTLSSSGRLTAKTVYDYYDVDIQATAQDGSGAVATASIDIRPKQDGMLSLYDDEGNNVTKTTKLVTADGTGTVYLTAKTLTPNGEEEEEVTWKSSRPSVATVVDGNVEVLGVGTATITATATDGTRRSASVTIKGVRLATDVEITHSQNQHALASGKSLTLKGKAYYLDDAGNRKTPTQSKLNWYIEEGGEDYATVSSNGKVTARAGLTESHNITVWAEATDGSEAKNSWYLEIAPAATGVQILLNGEAASRYTVALSDPVTKDNPVGGGELTLSAKVSPYYASNLVKWTTSNASVADFEREDSDDPKSPVVVDEETGNVTVNYKKPGTVTLTATAGDGSGKKATFRLTIVHVPESVEFRNTTYVAGGKTLTLKPVFLDENGDEVKGKSLEWTLTNASGADVDATAFCTLSKSGVLRTKKVTEVKTVEITVKTKEQDALWEVSESLTVDICPATTKVTITGSEGWAPVGAQVDLGVSVEPYNAGQNFTWKTSNAKIADFVRVDQDDPKSDIVENPDGTVTLIAKKAGTVTITATSKDGTGKKASIKIEIQG